MFGTHFIITYLFAFFFGIGSILSACSTTSEDDDLLFDTLESDYGDETNAQYSYSDAEDEDSSDEELGDSQVLSGYGEDSAFESSGSDEDEDPNLRAIVSDLDDIYMGPHANRDDSYPEELEQSSDHSLVTDNQGYTDDLSDVYSEADDVPHHHNDTHVAANFQPDSARMAQSGQGFGEYVVQPGDTLGKIAGLVLGSNHKWQDLANHNNIMNPSHILPGDIIEYPLTQRSEEFKNLYDNIAVEVVTVQAGDTLSRIAERLLGNPSYWRAIWRWNMDQIPDPNRIQVGQVIRYMDPNKVRTAVHQKGWAVYGH